MYKTKQYSIKRSTVFLMVLLTFFVFRSGNIEVYAYESIRFNVSSRESRILILELLANGSLVNKASERIVTQSSDKRKFKIITSTVSEQKFVYLIPEINGEFNVESIGTWKFSFDKNSDLESVSYYFQPSDEYRIIVKPYLSSIEVSLMVKGQYIYKDVLISMGIKNFIKMPLNKFIDETYSLLYWDWVFPEQKFVATNERTKNLINYLQVKLSDDFQERGSNLFSENVAINQMGREQLLLQRRKDEAQYIKKVVDSVMLYIGTDLADDSIFDVYRDDGDRISPADSRFFSEYMNNVRNFLLLYPDFYSSINTIDTAFFDELDNELTSLYVDLFFMTSKYPGLWYIVPIRRTQRVEDKNVSTLISLEVLIPYFNQDGSFEISGSNLLEQYHKEELESTDNSIKYFYDPPTILRVPSQYKIKMVE